MFPSITVTRTNQPKEKPAADAKLGFGQIFTDHMFSMDYVEGEGWINPRIEPYAPITLDPSAMIFHYGQAIFEGLKAYKTRRWPDQPLPAAAEFRTGQYLQRPHGHSSCRSRTFAFMR